MWCQKLPVNVGWWCWIRSLCICNPFLDWLWSILCFWAPYLAKPNLDWNLWICLTLPTSCFRLRLQGLHKLTWLARAALCPWTGKEPVWMWSVVEVVRVFFFLPLRYYVSDMISLVTPIYITYRLQHSLVHPFLQVKVSSRWCTSLSAHHGSYLLNHT